MKDNNNLVLTRLSSYLNDTPDYINESMIEELTSEGISTIEAVRVLLSSILNLYDNKEIMDLYIREIVSELNPQKYKDNLYYKNIKLSEINSSTWSIQLMKYKPYELFVYNDLKVTDDGRVIPKVGYFKEEYEYPCILENNREWMLITPNEIETMSKPIEECFGNVLTYGLGLGYFPYMASLKENVKSITIIEKDKKVIELFERYILPQFKNKDKINIINEDAYIYASTKPKFDYVFVDIWHDPSDGVSVYKKFKDLERPDVKYSYWIEDTIKYYL